MCTLARRRKVGTGPEKNRLMPRGRADRKFDHTSSKLRVVGAVARQQSLGEMASSSVAAAPSASPCHRFVLFSRPHSNADATCRLLNAMSALNVTCAGEVFAPHSAAARTVRARQNVSYDAMHAKPGKFLRNMRCSRGHSCGVVLFPYQLSNSILPSLFSSGCEDVRVLALERSNRTAEWLDFRSHATSTSKVGAAAGGTAWAQMPQERFAQLHQEWFGRVARLAASHRAPYLRLTSEALDLHSSREDAFRRSLRRFFNAPPASGATVAAGAGSSSTAIAAKAEAAASPHHKGVATHSRSRGAGGSSRGGGSSGGGGSSSGSGAGDKRAAPTSQKQPAQKRSPQPQPPPATKTAVSVAAAKAASHLHDEAIATHQQRRRRAVLLTAAAAFAATCLAGTCLALGIAIGQRNPPRRLASNFDSKAAESAEEQGGHDEPRTPGEPPQAGRTPLLAGPHGLP